MSDRPELQLESWRFTTASACAREVERLIESEDCRLILLVHKDDFDRIGAELESLRALGRLKVVEIDQANGIRAACILAHREGQPG